MLKAKRLALIILTSVLYFAFSTGFSFSFFSGEGYYGLLASGFKALHPYLIQKPSPQLLSLSDPYDPLRNFKYSLHDASLYRGHYYLYWGPLPALVRLIFLNKLGEQFYIFFYISGSTIFSFLIINLIKDKYFAKIHNFYLYLSYIFLGFNAIVLNLLASTGIYYESIAAGQFFFLSGLYFFIKYHIYQSQKDYYLSAVIISLSVLCRVNLILSVMALIFLMVSVREKRTIFNIILVLLPPLLCLLILGFYNKVRFNDFFDFGTTYQLAGINMHTVKKLQNIQNIPNNLKNYFFALPSLKPDYPFLYINLKYYSLVERMLFSLFLLSPVSLFIFIKNFNKNIFKIYISLLIVLLINVVSVSYLIPASAIRYMFEFIYLFNLIGIINLFSVLSDQRLHKFINIFLIFSVLLTLIAAFLFWVYALGEFAPSHYNAVYDAQRFIYRMFIRR